VTDSICNITNMACSSVLGRLLEAAESNQVVPKTINKRPNREIMVVDVKVEFFFETWFHNHDSENTLYGHESVFINL
jgi:hypothetical protein